MKTFTFFVMAALGLGACSSTKQQKEVTMLDRPGHTELTASKHVKERNGRENRDRVKYYNSLQYKNSYKPQN